MTRSTRYSPNVLEQWKPYIQSLYLEQELTAPTVVETLETECDLSVTKRQLKLRFEAWGWFKKVRQEYYCAMNKVIETNTHLPRPLNFNVTLVRGQAPKLYEAAKIAKQAQRTIKTGKRRGRPIGEMSYEDALELLNHANIEILNDMPLVPPSRPLRTVVPNMELGEDDDSDSDTGFDTPPYVESDFETHRPLTGTSTLTGSRPGTGQDETPEEITQLFISMTLSIEPTDTRRLMWARFLGLNVGDAYRPLRLRESEGQLMKFAAYYVQQSLYSDTTLDSFDVATRAEAKENLKKLLIGDSMQILPTVFYIQAVIVSNEQAELLKQFYSDCCECAESVANVTSRIVLPIFRAGKLISQQGTSIGFTSPQEECEQEEHAIKEIMLKAELDADFHRSKDLLLSMNQGCSSTFAITQFHHAWAFHLMGDHQKCLDMLTEPTGLPLLHSVMGSSHLFTVNCYDIMAICYEKMGNGLAQHYIDYAYFQLRQCPYPLLPYKFRLLQHISRTHLRRSATIGVDVERGIQALEDVLRFRWDFFGAFHKATWFAAEELVQSLKKHVGSEAAERRRQELEASHAQAWQLRRHDR
ncbi:hypothetical protein LTS08_001307 [Lithohypha guttulata]|nr:hypothetical protein LTS08_001307 [Lithohypha guttulata]